MNTNSYKNNNPVTRIVYFLLVILLSWSLFPGCNHIKPYVSDKAESSPDVTIPSAAIGTRFLFIGDAGTPRENTPVMLSLEKWAAKIPDITTIFFLGDNVYPSGLRKKGSPGRLEGEKSLLNQINTIKHSGAKAVFVPGNHDWRPGGEKGLSRIKEQQKFVVNSLGSSIQFLPKNGCPGPAVLDFQGVRAIILDTDHWIDQNIPWGKTCLRHTEQEVSGEISRLLTTAGEREVIVMAHHPFRTHGPHGGFFSWKDHLFPLTRIDNRLWLPLPIIGSFYPIFRGYLHVSNQDLRSKRYQKMIATFKKVFSVKKPLVYAAGHDHSLQVLDGGETAKFVLVSGAGSRKKLTAVGHDKDTFFAHLHTGFMCIDFLKDKRVLLRVVEPVENEIVFQRLLK